MTFEIPLRLLADVVGKICFVETFAQKLGLGSFVVGLAELLLDGPHLLAQQHLALLLGHLVLHFARDVSTDLQDSCLVLEVAVHQPKPVREVIGGEKLLRFVELETHDRSEHVEPAHAILFGANELRNVDRCLRLCKRKHFRAQRFHFALERLDIRAHVERNRRGLELGAEKRLFLRELPNPNSRRTLNEHLNATCGHGREAPDHGFRSDIEEAVAGRLLHRRVFLGDDENLLLFRRHADSMAAMDTARLAASGMPRNGKSTVFLSGNTGSSRA